MKVKALNFTDLYFIKKFRESLKDTGFAVVTNHGISPELIEAVQNEWLFFFRLPTVIKDTFKDEGNPNQGYKGLKTETAVGAEKADLKEFYHYYPGMHMSETTIDLRTQLMSMGKYLLNILNTEYGDTVGNDDTLLRVAYYPPIDNADGAVRAAEHTDINLITLLVAATASGLQVKDKLGNWHDVPHTENAVVVNVGDMLQMLTKGEYVSTPHRVINSQSSGTDRLSLPLFIHPRPSVELKPGFTAGEYLEQRLKEIYKK